MLRPRDLVVLLVAILLATAGGVGRAWAQAAADGPPPAVTVVEVASQEIAPTITFTGRVQAVDKVDLIARVEGFLTARKFTEGDTVAAGDLLFTIEKGAYQAAVDEAQGLLDAAQGDLKLAQVERDRQAILVQRKDAAQAVLDVAEANLAKAEGALKRAQGRLEQANLNLSYTDIKAPFAGRIGISTYSEGAYVGPDSGTLAILVSQDPIYVTFPASMRDVLKLRKQTAAGDRKAGEGSARLELADGSTYDQVGTFDFINVEVDPGTDTIEVRAVFQNPEALLVDQALVTVLVQAEAPKPTLVVPQVAVQFDQVGRYVLALDKDNKVEIRRITPGAPLGALIVVNEGLSAGDRVITDGTQKVRPGMTVDPEVAPMPKSTAVIEG
jgi:membrane fusion protein (multidrug efflux system)